jgi:hypothetical protein
MRRILWPIGILLLSLTTASTAQVSAPTEDELNAAGAGRADIVHSRGPVGGPKESPADIKNVDDSQLAGPGPFGMADRDAKPVAASSDPHDLRGFINDGRVTDRSFYTTERPGPQVKSKYETALLCLVPLGIQPAGGLIFQTPALITWVKNSNLRVRRIVMDQPHPQHVTPTYQGDSVGHWEGNTLVVDTIGLKGVFGYAGSNFHRPGVDIYDQPTKFKGEKLPPPNKVFDLNVVMATPTLHVTERIRKINNNAQLQDDLAFEDPTTGMKPYTMKVTFDYGQPREYVEAVCEDGNDRFGPAYGEALEKSASK